MGTYHETPGRSVNFKITLSKFSLIEFLLIGKTVGPKFSTADAHDHDHVVGKFKVAILC